MSPLYIAEHRSLASESEASDALVEITSTLRPMWNRFGPTPGLEICVSIVVRQKTKHVINFTSSGERDMEKSSPPLLETRAAHRGVFGNDQCDERL
jgi:hypothetical protein